MRRLVRPNRQRPHHQKEQNRPNEGQRGFHHKKKDPNRSITHFGALGASGETQFSAADAGLIDTRSHRPARWRAMPWGRLTLYFGNS
jgi:hypothetical protein